MAADISFQQMQISKFLFSIWAMYLQILLKLD